MCACVLRAGSYHSYTIFLTWIFWKLKFVTPTVDFAPPPQNVPSWFTKNYQIIVSFSAVFRDLTFLEYDVLSSGKLSPKFRTKIIPSPKRHTTLGTTQRPIPNISFLPTRRCGNAGFVINGQWTWQLWNSGSIRSEGKIIISSSTPRDCCLVHPEGTEGFLAEGLVVLVWFWPRIFT
jgi:hypothetical protein